MIAHGGAEIRRLQSRSFSLANQYFTNEKMNDLCMESLLKSNNHADFLEFQGVEEFPKASGSFTRLPGDNSHLALHPADWGKEGPTFKVGKWSHQGKKSLWDCAAFIKEYAHWLLQESPSRWECDDYIPPTPPVGSFWKIYVR